MECKGLGLPGEYCVYVSWIRKEKELVSFTVKSYMDIFKKREGLGEGGSW